MSGDIKLTWDATTLSADVSLEANDLVSDEGLQTAVLLSLFTDRRAEDGDVLPDQQTDRRGWWADEDADVAGDRIGSRLWMLERSAARASVLSQAEEYAREALAWLVEDKVAESIDVTASMPRADALGLEVSVYRPQQKEPTRFRFDAAWRAEGGT